MTTDEPIFGLLEVRALRRAGTLSASQFARAAHTVRDHGHWRQWASWALLALGAGHVLVGIVFFFAYNWADMPAIAKFVVIEVGIVLAAVAALWCGIVRPAGRALLIAASVLTGVLLAVIGQVYQTGADAYELFVAWMVLIVPWALASRDAGHWLLWLIVVDAAASLYAAQVLVPLGLFTATRSALVVTAIPIVALAIREGLVTRGFAWPAAVWTRHLLLFIALVQLFVMAVGFVFNLNNDPLTVILFGAALAIAAAVYVFLRPDPLGAAQAIGFVGFFLMAVGARAISQLIGFDFDQIPHAVGGLGLLTAWCIAVTVVMAKLLLPKRASAR